MALDEPHLLMAFSRAWLSTVLVETVTLVTLTRLNGLRTDATLSKVMMGGLFASSMTLPYLWFIAPAFWGYGFELMTYAEPIIFLFEGLFYMNYLNLGWKRSMVLSTVCNTTSVVFGLVFKSWFYIR